MRFRIRVNLIRTEKGIRSSHNVYLFEFLKWVVYLNFLSQNKRNKLILIPYRKYNKYSDEVENFYI